MCRESMRPWSIPQPVLEKGLEEGLEEGGAESIKSIAANKRFELSRQFTDKSCTGRSIIRTQLQKSYSLVTGYRFAKSLAL